MAHQLAGGMLLALVLTYALVQIPVAPWYVASCSIALAMRACTLSDSVVSLLRAFAGLRDLLKVSARPIPATYGGVCIFAETAVHESSQRLQYMNLRG